MEDLELFDILLYLTWVFYVVSIGSLIFNFKRLPSFIGRVLLFILLLGILTDVIGKILAQNHIYSYPVVYTYNTICTPLVFLLFWHEMKLKWIKQGILLLIGIYFLASVITFIIENDINFHSNIPYTSTIIGTMIFVLIYFLQVFQYADIPDLTRHFFFWVSSAFFIYYGAALFLMLMEDTIRSDIDLFLNLWPIQTVATIIFHVLLLIGIWRTRATSY